MIEFLEAVGLVLAIIVITCIIGLGIGRIIGDWD